MNNWIFTAYIQQIGRAGKNGLDSTALFFYSKSDIGRPEVADSMKKFCKNDNKLMNILGI